jgi:hypothetical protein
MLKLRRVGKSSKDIDVLYVLLRERTFGISHFVLPTPEDHREFVRSHPYRFWYIVEWKGVPVGSVYFHFDNSLGINVPNATPEAIGEVLKKALSTHRPLKAVKSVRSSDFHVNVSPRDEALKHALINLGWTPLQISFAPGAHTTNGGNDV